MFPCNRYRRGAESALRKQARNFRGRVQYDHKQILAVRLSNSGFSDTKGYAFHGQQLFGQWGC
jgi:hypothetical protein